MQRATPEAEVSFHHHNGGADPFGNAPPYSLEAEEAVLGAILVWNDILDDLPFLEPEHFFDPLHGQIMATARDVIRQGRIANPMTLGVIFKDAPPIDSKTSVLAYLGTLGAHATSRMSARDTARMIVDLSDRRQLILLGEDMIASAREANPEYPPKALIEEAEARLYTLAESHATLTPTVKSFSEAANDFVASAGGKSPGLQTGLRDLDEKLIGLQPSDLIILAGRPSMGKTALATNIAFHIAKSGQCPVDFYSLEMGAEQLAGRVLSERAGVPASTFRRGNAKDHELRKLAVASRELADTKFFIDQTGGISIAQLASRARRRKRRNGTGLIVVDYLQLMQASRRRENRVQDITEITTGLKALAKELNVPVLALSQLSRATEHRENKRPQLSDLRESGSIEQDADVVMFVYREEYYLEREEPADAAKLQEWQDRLRACQGKAEVIIGKARHSEPGSVALSFAGHLTRFSDLSSREVAR